jgi:hypothetical protein
MDLTKVRNTVTTSTAPIYGVSTPISCDTASLYPTMMSSMNGGKSAMSPQAKYFIKTEFPFEYNKVTGGKDLVYTKRDLDIIVSSVPFGRRLSAEQYRLKSLEKHYRDNGDNETAEMYNNKHKNLEQDHPEWLI